MLTCDGYKMFHGSVTVHPVNGRPPYVKTGTWMYKPETRYWYCEEDEPTTTLWAVGYSPKILTNFKEDVA